MCTPVRRIRWQWLLLLTVVCAIGAGCGRLVSAPARVVWRLNAASGQVHGFGASAGHVAVVLSDQVVMLSGTTGKMEWRTPLRGLVTFPPVALDAKQVVTTVLGRAVVSYGSTMQHELVALDAPSGQVQWETPVPSPVASPPEQLLLTTREIVGASGDGTIWAVARNGGRLLWSAQVPRPVTRSPVGIDGNRVIAFWAESTSPYDAGVDCLSLSSGQLLWRQQVSTGRLSYVRGLVAAGRAVFFWGQSSGGPSTPPNQVSAACFQAKTGKQLWAVSLPYADLLFSHRGMIYGLAGDAQGAGRAHTLWQADLRTGRLRGEVSAAPALRSLRLGLMGSPVLSQGAVVVLRATGRDVVSHNQLLWVDLQTSKVRGEYEGATDLGYGFGLASSSGLVIAEAARGKSVVALSLPPNVLGKAPRSR